MELHEKMANDMSGHCPIITYKSLARIYCTTPAGAAKAVEAGKKRGTICGSFLKSPNSKSTKVKSTRSGCGCGCRKR